MCACSHDSFPIPGPCTPRPILLFKLSIYHRRLSRAPVTDLNGTGFYGAWHGAAVTSTASAVDIGTTSRQLLFSGSAGGMASDRYKLVCLILQVAAVTSRCSSSSSDVRVFPSQFPDSWAVYASTDPAFHAFNLSSASITGTGNGLEWDWFLRRMARRSSDVYGISGGYKNDIATTLQWVRRRHGVRSLQASLLDFTGGRSYQQMQFFVVRCARAPITVSRFLGHVRLDRFLLFKLSIYHRRLSRAPVTDLNGTVSTAHGTAQQ
ncbi:hypothetical protein MRX96_056519 [Rhipicephalus microplus]